MLSLTRSLSKLKMVVVDRRQPLLGAGLEVNYNPDSIRLDHQLEYVDDRFINQAHGARHFVRTQPATLHLDLELDATLPGNDTAIDTQLDQLRQISLMSDNQDGTPYVLRLYWGQFAWMGEKYFSGQVQSIGVNYTLFDRDATPLRATVHLAILQSAESVEAFSRKSAKLAYVSMVDVPDLSSLDKLAALTSMISAASAATNSLQAVRGYLAMAFANDLDSLDDFTPGDQLGGAQS